MPAVKPVNQPRAAFEKMLAETFRRAGWRVRRLPAAGEWQADFIIENGSMKYAVVVKHAPEERRDRLIPLLSQAILEVQAFLREFPERALPLAVVASMRVPETVAARIREFGARYTPDVAVGVVDAEGFRLFTGSDLQSLNAKPARRSVGPQALARHVPDLFSDLNQWMLKILIGQELPAPLITIPRDRFRSATHLAAAAKVSIMSATRFVNQFAKEGFLDEDSEYIQIVRADELLDRWTSANREGGRDVPARFLIKRDEKQFLADVARWAAGKAEAAAKESRRRHPPRRLRCCAGLFAAAEALGVGFVRGVPPRLYLERVDLDVLRELGLSVEESGRRADVHIRIPSKKETVFRAAVVRDGLPVCDVLQVWLDASAFPARGQEQADEIRRRVLKPLYGGRR